MLRRRIRFKKRYWYRARLITNCYGVRVFDQFLNLIWSASVRSVLRTNVIPNFPSVVFFYISSRKITFCQLFVLVQCGISSSVLDKRPNYKKIFLHFCTTIAGISSIISGTFLAGGYSRYAYSRILRTPEYKVSLWIFDNPYWTHLSGRPLTAFASNCIPRNV